MDENVSVLRLPHLEGHAVYLALFKNVSNAAFLRQQLIDGNSQFEYAFLDATSILTPNHLYAAVFRAINDSLNGRLKSRNVHSEIVFSLIPNNNIAESFRKFGVTDGTQSLIAVKVIPPMDDVEQSAQISAVGNHLSSNVTGDKIPFTEENLAATMNLANIRKIYKTPANTKSKSSNTAVNGTSPSAAEIKELERIVLGLITIKGS